MQDKIILAIRSIEDKTIADALEGFYVLTIHYHYSGCCKYSRTLDVSNCTEPFCQNSIHYLRALIKE